MIYGIRMKLIFREKNESIETNKDVSSTLVVYKQDEPSKKDC